MSLNKRERLQKKRNDEEEAKMEEAAKLNPSFPYKMEIFPYNFFGIENLSQAEEEKATS